MKKVLIFFLFTLLTLLCLSACGKKKEHANTTPIQVQKVKPTEPLLEYSGETSQGTPIINHDESSISISDFGMVDTPDSTCFSQIGYDRADEILFVTFRESSSSYIYLDFSESAWNEFIKADSLGGYFNSDIKNYYECNKW